MGTLWAQDTRRMYQDEVDMMEIELLGRERAERLAAERATAEATGRAELARMQVRGTETMPQTLHLQAALSSTASVASVVACCVRFM